jgi:HK97 family phage portal protein
MKFWNRVRNIVHAAITTWKGETFDFSSWFGRKFWGSDNSTLATNELIFTAIAKKSDLMASLPLKLYKDFDVISNDVSDVVVNSPNVNMTEFDFIRLLEVSRNAEGNGYALIIPNVRSRVEQLIPLDPTYVEELFDSESNELWYKVKGQNGDYYFHNMSIIHVKYIHSASSWRGISPIKVLANTLKFDKAVKEFSISEMQQAPNSFILEYNANVDKDKRQRIIDDFKRFYQDNGGVLFQEPGVKIDEIERKFVAADIANAEKITAKRIANVFNIPIHMLGESEGQSYSSIEQLMREFVMLTIMPIARQYEQEFNRKLLNRDERKKGYYFKFNLKGLLRGDIKAQTDFYNSGIRNGYLEQDEVRQWEDLPPRGGNASKLWVSGDLYPIDLDPSERKGSPRKGGGED